MATKSVVRSVKNVTKGYSSVEVKVRNATSNDAWGPSGTDMGDIAQMTFNSSTDFYQIMDMLDKRLNDKGKNWRHVLKSLKVLDYCLHEGSEHVVTWARKNVYIIKTLREFQYIDDDGRDVGLNVRTSAKELTSLILDEERLRAERHDRKLWKSRVTGLDDGLGRDSSPPKPRKEARRPNRQNDEEDLEYRLAIEASKNEAEEDRRRRQSKGPDNDEDLERAIKLSKEEEELRRRELEEQNANSLFDDTPVQQPQPTGWNQGYQQQGAVDWFGNPVEQQQQSTGFLNNAYAQPTGFQNGFGYGQPQQQQQQQHQQQQQQQQQPFGFDQSQFQQQQQPQFMQPQQTAFNMNNPYGSNGFGGQPQQQQQPLIQHQEEQSSLQPGSNNPWAATQPSLSLDSGMKPQPTGSNNPFATSFPRPQTSSAQRPPTLATLQEQKPISQFAPQPLSQQQQQQPSVSFAAPTSKQSQKEEEDPHLARLNQLLATGEGIDTFGNVGDLRIPAQHTAPGTFVNSAGSGANRLAANQTGMNNNPYYMQTQFTGMQTARPAAMMPAQTGPAGAFAGGMNQFGATRGNQQQQQRQGGASAGAKSKKKRASMASKHASSRSF